MAVFLRGCLLVGVLFVVLNIVLIACGVNWVAGLF